VSTSGHALTGSTVTLRSQAGLSRQATSDGNGRYEFVDLQAGTVQVTATASGFHEQSSEVTLEADRILNFVLAAEDPPADDPDLPAHPDPDPFVVLAGRVADATAPDRGIAGARVTVTSGEQTGRESTTDTEGWFRFAQVTPGDLTLRVSAPGFDPVTESLRAGSTTTVEILLSPLVPAFVTAARVVDVLTGAPIVGVTVAGDDIVSRPSTTNGRIEIGSDVADDSLRPVTVSGPGMIDRQIYLQIPGDAIEVSLIPDSFEIDAFDEMFRGPGLRRWTNAPPLVVERCTVTFEAVEMADGEVGGPCLSAADEDTLVNDLTLVLAQLTGDRFAAFASVTSHQPPAGTRVPLLVDGVITVVRVAGLKVATGFTGYGRWRHDATGRVIGGLIMLDADHDAVDGSARQTLRAHELGHALGYGHVTKRGSVMNAAAGLLPLPFDREASRIAFSREPGSRSPDVDPVGGSRLQNAGRATWSAPLP